MIQFIVGLGVPILFLALGWFVGRRRERQHFASLDAREAALSGMLVTQVKSFPCAAPGELPPKLIVAEAVMATDYLKSFLAGLRNLVGGEVRSYESLLVRARREATLRIMEEARRSGYNAVCNVRLNTADIGGNTATANNKNRGSVMASILASATAYHASPPA